MEDNGMRHRQVQHRSASSAGVPPAVVKNAGTDACATQSPAHDLCALVIIGDDRRNLDSSHKYIFMDLVKTTLEIPDLLYRRLKASAAHQGRTVRALVNEAIVEKLQKPATEDAGGPPWRKGFGALRHLHTETRRIEQIINQEFSSINPEDWK
jgi:hypothetical protein